MLNFFLSVIETETDKGKFKYIYERHLPGIKKAACRYTGSDLFEAEDLMQEMWRNVSAQIERLTFKDEKAERIYLHTALRNCAQNMWRKNKSRHLYELPMEREDSIEDDTFADPAELIVNADIQTRAKEIVNNLSQADREILSLLLYSDLSINEIATVLNIKQETAKKRLQRAKMRLAEELKKAGVIDVK